MLTFENSEDYVYQSKFHPLNPSLFTTVDGQGKLDIWDININTETPIISQKVSPSALNKVSWSDDGKRLAAGDASGKVYLYNLDKEIMNSSAEDSIKLERIIAQAQNNKQSLKMNS